jgi:hypothetical protein
MKLFHFTALYHLPPIARDGLSKGEIPVNEGKNAHGPNFTTNPKGSVQGHWATGAISDKTKIRIAVDIAESDPKLIHWKTKGWKGSRSHLRLLDSFGQGKFWYVYVDGVVPPPFLEIAIRETADVYRPLEGRELLELVERSTKSGRGFRPC